MNTKVFSDDTAFNREMDRIVALIKEGFTGTDLIKKVDNRNRWMIKQAMREAAPVGRNSVKPYSHK